MCGITRVGLYAGFRLQYTPIVMNMYRDVSSHPFCIDLGYYIVTTLTYDDRVRICVTG